MEELKDLFKEVLIKNDQLTYPFQEDTRASYQRAGTFMRILYIIIGGFDM